MKRRVDVNGDIVRKEREKRAWTQEELSERSNLGVRTVRRLEAGEASLATIQRVADALALESEITAPVREPVTDTMSNAHKYLQVDPLEVQLGTNLVGLVDAGFLERIGSIRRHIALELGFLASGVRLTDQLLLQPNEYSIKVRGLRAGGGIVYPDRFLAIGKEELLAQIPGERTQDPTYAMPAVWLEETQRSHAEAIGCMVFTPVTVVATHLTHLIKCHASRLLGIEETQALLSHLHHPNLVAELIPSRLSLPRLRTILRGLLVERVSIRDLALILETLVDHATPEATCEELIEVVRRALAETICLDYANRDRQLVAIVLDASLEERLEGEWESRAVALKQRLQTWLEEAGCAGMQPLVVTAARLRRRIRSLFSASAHFVVLSRAEVAEGFEVTAWRVVNEQ